MHPQLTVILADQRVADIGGFAEQAYRARDVRRREYENDEGRTWPSG
jgi:hypothetical protein